jgi:hypothetical protein
VDLQPGRVQARPKLGFQNVLTQPLHEVGGLLGTGCGRRCEPELRLQGFGHSVLRDVSLILHLSEHAFPPLLRRPRLPVELIGLGGRDDAGQVCGLRQSQLGCMFVEVAARRRLYAVGPSP